MFEFITISNGVAVVQHAPTGFVYRFRPVHPGVWSQLSLDAVDRHEEGAARSDEHAGAALNFAQEAAEAACRAAFDVRVPVSRAGSLASMGRLRRPVLS